MWVAFPWVILGLYDSEQDRLGLSFLIWQMRWIQLDHYERPSTFKML